MTIAGTLPYKAIIHCVAGDDSHRSSEPIIEACVRSALAKAAGIGCATVAMRVFATGHARFGFDRALRAMLRALRGTAAPVREAIIVAFDEERAAEARRIIESS